MAGVMKTNSLESFQMKSVTQLAKEYSTTYPSMMKWLKEANVKIHKIGRGTWVWTNELKFYLNQPMTPFVPLEIVPIQGKPADEIQE